MAELLASQDPTATAHAKSLLQRARPEHERLDDLRARADAARQSIDGTFGSLLDHFGRTLKPMVPSWKRPVAGAGVLVATAVAGAAPAAVSTSAGAGWLPSVRGLLREDCSCSSPTYRMPIHSSRDAWPLRTPFLLSSSTSSASTRTCCRAAGFHAAPRHTNADILERVLAMLAESDGWVHREQIRRDVDVTPGSLTRALEAAVAEGLLRDQTEPDAVHTRQPQRVIEYRSVGEGRQATAS